MDRSELRALSPGFLSTIYGRASGSYGPLTPGDDSQSLCSLRPSTVFLYLPVFLSFCGTFCCPSIFHLTPFASFQQFSILQPLPRFFHLSASLCWVMGDILVSQCLTGWRIEIYHTRRCRKKMKRFGRVTAGGVLTFPESDLGFFGGTYVIDKRSNLIKESD